MSSLTKQKIMLLLNDIYLKSKENKVFKPAAICAHYHVGHQLCTVLLKNGYIKYIDRGKYLYQGKPIDEQLVDEVYSLYSQYKSDQKKEYNSKQKSNHGELPAIPYGYLKDNKQKVRFLSDTDLIDMLFKRFDELNKKVNELEKQIHKLYEDFNARNLNRLHENKLIQKKSFIGRLFNS